MSTVLLLHILIMTKALFFFFYILQQNYGQILQTATLTHKISVRSVVLSTGIPWGHHSFSWGECECLDTVSSQLWRYFSKNTMIALEARLSSESQTSPLKQGEILIRVTVRSPAVGWVWSLELPVAPRAQWQDTSVHVWLLKPEQLLH